MQTQLNWIAGNLLFYLCIFKLLGPYDVTHPKMAVHSRLTSDLCQKYYNDDFAAFPLVNAVH